MGIATPFFRAARPTARPDGMDSLGMPRTLCAGRVAISPRCFRSRSPLYMGGRFQWSQYYRIVRGLSGSKRGQRKYPVIRRFLRRVSNAEGVNAGDSARELGTASAGFKNALHVGADGAHGSFGWSAAFGDFAFMRLILTRPRAAGIRNPQNGRWGKVD